MDNNNKNVITKGAEENIPDIADIANEVTFRSYAISKFGSKSLFQNLTALDYMTLFRLSNTVNSENDDNKIYLEDIAREMKLPISSVSKLVKTLQERGLVVWKHDGAGDEGTYIQITEKGMSLEMEQQEKLKSFYVDVVARFGKEKFITLLEQLKELQEIMDSEAKIRDVENGGN